MISLKDYNFLYSDTLYDPSTKKNLKSSNDLPFSYLYPSEVQPPERNIYYNQKQQLFTVTILQDLQQSQKIIQLIKNKDQVFSTSQQFIIAEHKNPNAQKRFIVGSSIDREHTLKYIAQNCFFQNAKVPNEQFCSDLIERMLIFISIFEQKGFHLKLITPEHILYFEEKFYLAYPFVHDLSETSVKVYEQFLRNEKFCAPEILKVIQNSKPLTNKQSQEPNNTSGIIINSAPLASNLEPKGFKKSILYSLALSILYCFGYQIPVNERYSALRNPRHLNNHLDQLRKQVKIHHDGKYISKLLKLMLEHSESLRDTINTFSYKMNSVQFRMLKRIIDKSPTQQKEQNIRTESEINSNPMLRTSSGRKTIDIRISSMSNASSLINRSWLSGSQRQAQKMMSPFDTNKSLPGEKEYLQRSRHEMSPKELNKIEEQKNDQNDLESPIEFDIDWDQDSSARGSNKSRKLNKSKKKSDKQSSDGSKKSPPEKLLNRISEKQENEQQAQAKAEKGSIKTSKSKDKESDIRISVSSINDQIEVMNQNEDEKISRTQSGIKGLKSVDEHFRTEPQIKEDKSVKDLKEMKKCSKKDEQIMDRIKTNNLNELKYEESLDDEEFKQYEEGFKNIFYSKQSKQLKPETKQNPSMQLSKVNEPSLMALRLSSQLPTTNIDSITLNESTTFQINHHDKIHNETQIDPNDIHNESLIFEEELGDGEEFQAHQLFLKKAKSKQKDKLTERKKDQYNQRSRIILVTLVVIYGVFQLIQWLLNRQQTVQ